MLSTWFSLSVTQAARTLCESHEAEVWGFERERERGMIGCMGVWETRKSNNREKCFCKSLSFLQNVCLVFQVASISVVSFSPAIIECLGAGTVLSLVEARFLEMSAIAGAGTRC